MKTITPLIDSCPQANPVMPFLPGLACLLFSVLGVSCQNTGVSPQVDAARPLAQTHWVQVSSRPPTYYPRGVAANCPTDHQSGEWVYTDDARGTRYFIPLHGVRRIPRQSLVQEALAARSEKKLGRIAAEDMETNAKGMAQTVAFGPLLVVGGFMAGMGGGDITDLDYLDLQRQWYSSKQPKL